MKSLKKILAGLLVLTCVFVLASCDKGNVYKVTFNPNNGDAANTVDVEEGKKVVKPTDPEKVGYEFDGWYEDEALQNEYDFNDPVTADLTLYASWEAVKTYTVTFNPNGGTVSVSSSVVNEGTKVAKPTDPQKEGYRFVAWFTEEGLVNEYDFDNVVTADIALYAKWEEVLIYYEVTFVTNSDSKLEKAQVAKGGKLVAPTSPSKEGCQFDGWYVDEDLTEEFDFDTPITKDITLYAKWDGRVYIGSTSLASSFTLFNFNKGEKANKHTEFFDRTQNYMVGDDNGWNVMPDTDFIKYNPDTDDFDPTSSRPWVYDISIYDNADGSKLSDTTNLIDSIDTTKCLIDFSDNAIGKSFRVVVTPTGLTDLQLEEVEDYTVTFNCDVVDGYNVYDAKELSLIENRTEGEDSDAWKDFKEANNIALDLQPVNLIFHKNIVLTANDLPSYYFYQESELSKSDSDYERTLGSMKDNKNFLFRNLGENEEFHIYGNYFTLDTSSLREVTRESGKITEEGAVISHSTLIRFEGSETASTSIENLNMLGNAPRVENTIKAGGQIFIKVQGPSFTAYNNIAACLFITYMPNYTFTPFIIDKCKAYDAFNCFVYNWGSDKVEIKDSEMIGAGGPVIIQDHVNPTNSDGGSIGKTVITNSKLESYVTGSEGWFSVVGASVVVPQIKGLDALFNPFGKSFMKYTSDKSLSYLNIICVNKSGSAEGLTAEKIKGSLKIDEYSAFDFGETNPYLAGMLNTTFSMGAPTFQSSTGGFGYGTESGLFDIQNSQIVDPTNPIYSGEYLCLYYQGMAITLEYFNVNEIYTPEN